MTASALTVEDALQAEKGLSGLLNMPKMLTSEPLNRLLGFDLYVFPANLLPTGAFKICGALNNVMNLTEEERRRGVIAGSAGNHAKALAYAGKKFGVPVTILMPDDAPEIKIRDTIDLGAKVEFCKRDGEKRDAVVARLAQQTGSVIVHSYDNMRTIAGQGALGVEIHRQFQKIGRKPDALIGNCSGGGLMSGIALSKSLYQTPPAIYTAEPEEFDDARRSLASGVLQGNDKTSGSVADALLLSLCPRTFDVLRAHGAQGLTANDDEIAASMGVYADYFKLVVEAGGSVAMAAAIKNHKQFEGKTVAVIASGGNVDEDTYVNLLRRGRFFRKNLLAPNP